MAATTVTNFTLLLLLLHLCTGFHDSPQDPTAFVSHSTSKADDKTSIYAPNNEFPDLRSRNLPCPVDTTIAPCICTVDSLFRMTMNCSGVADETELKNIFKKSHFPITNFHIFLMHNNVGVKELKGNVFGNVTFEIFELGVNSIKTIDDDVFENSKDHITEIHLANNDLTSFPFIKIKEYSKLTQLFLDFNQLGGLFPKIESNSLIRLSAGYNQFDSIDGNALSNLPQLENFAANDCKITTIATNAFTYMPNLYDILLENNQLSSLPSTAISITRTDVRSHVNLYRNKLTTMDVDAIKGVTGNLVVSENALTMLDENVWRPMIEYTDLLLFLGGNALSCGCEIAWLIIDPTLLSHVADHAACDDGEFLVDLDPEIYMNLCY